MTLYEYLLLSDLEQAEVTWQGEYFWFRQEEGCTVLRYKVHGFYVEVYYNDMSNEITRLNPFSAKQRLELHFTLQQN